MTGVSFDFDGTMTLPDGRENRYILYRFYRILRHNPNTFVITERMDTPENRELVLKGVTSNRGYLRHSKRRSKRTPCLRGKLPIFIFTNGAPKVDFLLKENIGLHFDDDLNECILCEKAGIRTIRLNYTDPLNSNDYKLVKKKVKYVRGTSNIIYNTDLYRKYLIRNGKILYSPRKTKLLKEEEMKKAGMIPKNIEITREQIQNDIKELMNANHKT